MSLIVCFSSRDFAGICEAIEVLAASRNITAVSLPYLPLELSESRLVSLVRCADAIALADGNSDNKAYTDAIWSVGTRFSSSGKRIQTSLETDCFNTARFFTLSKR